MLCQLQAVQIANTSNNNARAALNEAKAKHESTQFALHNYHDQISMQDGLIKQVTRCTCHLGHHLVEINLLLCMYMQAVERQTDNFQTYKINNTTEFNEFTMRQQLLVHQLTEAASEATYNTLGAFFCAQ